MPVWRNEPNLKKPDNSSWIYFFIRHKTFGVTIAIALCFGLSLFSWIRIPIEVMPKENTPPFLYLRVEALAPMNPERMELALAIPLEGAVRTLSGILKVTSNTDQRGVSLSLTYKPRTDLGLAEFSLQEALQDLETRGYLDLRKTTISRSNPESSAVMKFSVTYDSSVKNPVRAIKEDLRIHLESIAEVSKIEVSGIEPLEYQYRIPTSKTQELGLGSQGLSAFTNFQPMRESLGEASFGSEHFSTAINARLLLSDLSQLQDQSIKQSSTLTLNQVASVRVVDHAREEISRKNGEQAVFVEIYSKEGANLFELNKHLQEELKKIGQEEGDLSRLKFEAIFNKTDDLRKAIDDVFQSLYEAVLITFLIVFLFLRKWRPTLLISLSIPATLLMTIFVLYLRGVSLNILTLSGLILGIGMVVDSAVLLVGKVTELRAQGLSHQEAAGRGATGVASALFMSTLTNAAIFLPVAFLEGGDSFTDILIAFQVPILASLASSLIVALLFLPVLMIHWKDKGTNSSNSKEPAAPAMALAIFRWLQRHRMPSALVTLAIVGMVFQYVLDIRQTDIESPRDPYSTLSVRFAPEIAPSERKKLFEELEKGLLNQKKSLNYRFIVADCNPELLSASVLVYPKASENQDLEIVQQEERLKTFLSQSAVHPGFLVSLGWGGYSMGSSSQQSQTFRFTGPKMAKLIDLTNDMKSQIKQIQGISDVHLEQEESGDRHLLFIPNEPVLLSYGMDLNKLSHEISSMMSSTTVSNLQMNGQLVGAKISFVPSGERWNLDSLRQMKIQVREGRYVSLIDLGTLVPMSSTRSVSHNEGVASSKIYVYFEPRLNDSELSQTQRQVRNLIEAFHFPHGYGPPASEGTARIEEMARKSQFIIYLSALLIYLLLAAMFESILLPFAILFTVPLALIFGVAGLKVLGMDLDVMARLSLIILVGIGVNSAIILIDLITSLREEGIRREDAVVMGCARRLKAVLMTTSIQIISVLPVALGKSKIMGIPYSSLGVSIISGMLLSTAVTLVVLPMIYEWLDDVENRIGHFLGLKQKSVLTATNESKTDQFPAASAEVPHHKAA